MYHITIQLQSAAARLCATGGSDTISFWVGIKGACRLARRYGPKVRLDEGKLKVARYLFDRHGAKLVFIGRYVCAARLRGLAGRDNRLSEQAEEAYPGPLE